MHILRKLLNSSFLPVKVVGTDKDKNDVLTYSLVPNPEDTDDLFYLNPSTGVITLKKLWLRGEQTEYRVRTSIKKSA